MRLKLKKDINLTAMPPGQARYQKAGSVVDLPDEIGERMLDADEAELFYPEKAQEVHPEPKAKK